MPDSGASRICPAGGDTALVLCAGGSHGALKVGFARALSDPGIRYDQILGTSIGAVNGAFLAGGISADDLTGPSPKTRPVKSENGSHGSQSCQHRRNQLRAA